jgi:hypothetical protein
MKKQRKHYTPEEKVAILRRHLVEGMAISGLCDELGPADGVLPALASRSIPPDPSLDNAALHAPRPPILSQLFLSK